MSIRIRCVNGVVIAVCAAKSVEKPGDIYLDDGAHFALNDKFSEDFNSEGLVPRSVDAESAKLREQEESNNPNRTWWDKTFGASVLSKSE